MSTGAVKAVKLLSTASAYWRGDAARDKMCIRDSYYIFQGAHDNNTPSALVQAYYDAIEAPDKDLIWFEHSAHGPLREEPETYKRLLREKLLQWI